MGRKSRHYRDESDPLLGFYSRTMSATSSTRSSNPLYTSERNIDSSPSYYSDNAAAAAASSHQHPSSSDDTSKTSPSSSNEELAHHNNKSSSSSSKHYQNAKHQSKQQAKRGKGGGYRVHRVSYTPQNHVQVIFQMYGSAFPQVLPFCILNIGWTLVVYHLRAIRLVDLTFHSSVGHSFMGLLVSFLIVSRSKISYDRFMDFRRQLATVYRACRELGQFTTVYTFGTQTNAARLWRQEVCYRTILWLRVTMDALLWSSTERDRWEDEYYTIQSSNVSSNYNHHGCSNHGDGDVDMEGQPILPEDPSIHFWQFRELSHGRRSLIDENFRAPITFAHVLRQTIMEHPMALGYKMPVNEYRDLLDFVTKALDAFHEFRVLIFTPYPFPLVQMTRAFLFVWVYTLPMVLLKEYRLWSSLLIVLLVSFGFVGIEYVSMALDDPFGDDTNDVDEHGMALLVYEDIYLALYRTDGPEAAFQLRERVLDRYKQGRGLDCYRDDLQGHDIWEPMHLRRRPVPP